MGHRGHRRLGGTQGHTNTWGYYCFYGKEKENLQFGTGFFTPHNNISS